MGLVSNTEIDIFFGIDQDRNFVMRIDEKGKIEMINIQDVESANRVDAKKIRLKLVICIKQKNILLMY